MARSPAEKVSDADAIAIMVAVGAVLGPQFEASWWIQPLLLIGVIAALAFMLWQWKRTAGWHNGQRILVLVLVAVIGVAAGYEPFIERYRKALSPDDLQATLDFKDSEADWCRPDRLRGAV